MSSSKSNISVLVNMVALVIVIWALSAVLIYFSLNEWSDRGTFGDLFGAVNALFSGLAFAALLYTIFLQREEITMNRTEITMNRKELSKSVKAQQEAHNTLIQQVAQTHLTAKISAMNTIVSYYNSEIQSAVNSQEVKDKAKQKRKLIIKQIDELIDGLNDSNVD